MAWTIDPAHTQIGFSVRHMMLSKVNGEFMQFAGEVDFDESNPAATTLTVTIETASVNTRFSDRDNHLRSADFFDSATYPHMTFVSKRVDVTGDNSATLYGDLTIKDVTREVALDVTYVGKAVSPWGVPSVGFNASTTIKRTDWGLNWNAALEAGGVLVGEEVSIAIETELVQQPEAMAAA